MTASTVSIVPANERKAYAIGNDITSAKNVSEALDLAGLNWGLMLKPAGNLTLMDDDDVYDTSIPGMNLLMRDDNFTTLGVVGGRYNPLNNHSVFSLADHFISQGGTYLRGGEQDHGRLVFMDIELPNSTVALENGKDLTKFHVSIRGNNRGNGNVVAEVVGKRLSCMNGQTVNIKGIPHSFKVAHNGTAERRMLEAKNILKGAGEYVRQFTAAIERMISIKMSIAEFTKYIDTIYPEPTGDDVSLHSMTIWESRRSELLTLFKFAETNNAGRGTAYAAFNTITEHLDWAGQTRRVNGRNETQARARSLFLGSDKVTEAKTKAFEMALAA